MRFVMVVCSFVFIIRMTNGWIKLHRKINENPFYSNPNALALLIECLLRARHDDKEICWKRERINLKGGQFLAGEEELGKTFNISRTTTRYWLEQFSIDNIDTAPSDLSVYFVRSETVSFLLFFPDFFANGNAFSASQAYEPCFSKCRI